MPAHINSGNQRETLMASMNEFGPTCLYKCDEVKTFYTPEALEAAVNDGWEDNPEKAKKAELDKLKAETGKAKQK